MHCIPIILGTFLGVTYVSSHVNVNAFRKYSEYPTVTTPLGKIRGTVIKSRLDRAIYSFRGIRYAEAPIDGLRFKPPVAVQKYEGIYNATADAPLCPQPTSNPTSEDCLFLNVYTTKLPKENEIVKRPVIIYIHAGGFYSVGSASYWEGPQYFMDQDIVLVTINYRLATLGFLATGEKDAPGNNGLKDQVEAFKWVKQNIEAFGGNSSCVTILGYSAGAMSVVLHMVSPMSAGLFHRAAALSGSPTSQWPIKTNQLELAKKQASFVNCPNFTTIANLMTCLKQTPAKDLGDSLDKFQEFGSDPIMIWTPVIEPDYGQTRFLTAHPITLLLKGEFHKVPFITGVTTYEFAYRAIEVLNNNTLLDEINANWTKIAPIAFMYERDSVESMAISNSLKHFYLNDSIVSNASLNGFEQLYADSSIAFGVNRAVKLISAKNTQATFYYKFSYVGNYSHYYLPNSNNTKPMGPVHHDDLIYLFYISESFPLFEKDSPKEVEMVFKLTQLYANFAKFGTPIPSPNKKLDNVTWYTFNNETQYYMDIGEKLAIKQKLFENRYLEWEKLFPLNKYILKY